MTNAVLGIRLRSAGHAQQTLPDHAWNHPHALIGPAGCVLWVSAFHGPVGSFLLTIPSAYPLASLGYANWILRNFGYKAVFIFGLVLYGIGALCMWPAGLNQSFGGFCAATFVIGSGLGSLETAANPYLSGWLLLLAIPCFAVEKSANQYFLSF